MRATTLISLALAAVTPALGDQYQRSCKYLSMTSQGAVPDKLKYRCERLGGKVTACTELTLSDCIGVEKDYGSVESHNHYNGGKLFSFPHGCQGCKWDAELTTIKCRCTNKDNVLAYPTAVQFDNVLSNYDGTIVGYMPQCRSKRVSC